LLGLDKAGVDFICADMPNANRLTVGIMAMVAEEEGRMISARTWAALQAAKKRGTVLGGDRGRKPTAKMRKLSAEARQQTAAKRAALGHLGPSQRSSTRSTSRPRAATASGRRRR